MHSFLRRRLPALLALGAAATVVACEFDRQTVGPRTARPVVHAVLNPFVWSEFTVLLERSLTGRVTVREGKLDTADVVVSGSGDPLSGARVVLYSDELRDSGVAIEEATRRTDGRGRGVYVFENFGCGTFYCPPHGIILRRGVTYRLEITTPLGERMSGTTQIPVAYPRPDTASRRTFHPKRDTYVFSWRPAETLERYAVQIQTPFGPFQTFSSAESLAINGSFRNFQQRGLPRVFVPGFRQPLMALAVDRGYFDYYRTENNAFTGQGLVGNMTGGAGLFGAIHELRYQDLDVVGDFDEPLDGRWRLEGDNSGFPPVLTTYTDGSFVSGRLENVFDPELTTLRGVLGARIPEGLRLAVLAKMSARDTAWTMTAEARGDTLFTSSPEKGDQRWRRIPTGP